MHIKYTRAHTDTHTVQMAFTTKDSHVNHTHTHTLTIVYPVTHSNSFSLFIIHYAVCSTVFRLLPLSKLDVTAPLSLFKDGLFI